MTWYYKVKQDLSKIIDCIEYYNGQLSEAKMELGMKGRIEKHSSELPSIVENRFNELQDIEAILEFLNIELRKIRSHTFKKYLETYNRALSSADVKQYVEGEQAVIDQSNLVNEFALLRNQYLGIMKALEVKGFQINNIVKLRSAGLDDASL